MRRFLIALAALATCAAFPALAAETYVQCDVKLDLPGGRLEARITGDAKGFNDMGEATVIVPVTSDFLRADPPHAFDIADPAGQTAEYRVHFRYDWTGDSPPPPFSKAGAKHPWWPVGDVFTGPPLPASANPDNDWTYAVWASDGVQVKGGDNVYMTSRDKPHRAGLGVEYQRSDDQVEAAKHAQERVAFITALSARDNFALVFLNRENARLGAARVDATLLKAIPDLSDRAYEEAARMRKAGKCLVKKD